MMLFVLALVLWATLFALNLWLSRPGAPSWAGVAVPILFGVALLVLWEATVRGFNVPRILLPPPSSIVATIFSSLPILFADFMQTVVKGALTGYLLGCSAAVGVAILVDQVSFLRRGLLPVGNFVAALPIIGLAPILVMWFGFDWQSKAAVVVVMVFFPMLVNTVEGLMDTDKMQRDLIRTYGSSYWQGLIKLRFPAALPFIFNGLKIASTLALIGAIVAEFFGSPIMGMGFRISTAVGQLNLELVWSEILVAALVGTGSYGLLSLVEKRLTFWHPSQRGSS